MDLLLMLLIDPILWFFYHLGRGVIWAVTFGRCFPAPTTERATGQFLTLIGLMLLFGFFMYMNN